MHADEVPISRQLVDMLIAEQFPQWSSLQLTAVPSAGTDHAMYRLGKDKVVRLPRIGWAVAAVQREQAWLPVLAAHLPLEIPTPIAKGEPTDNYPYPWSIYKWIEGENPKVESHCGDVSLANEVAGFVRAMRVLTFDHGPLAWRNGPLSGRDLEVRRAIRESADEFDPTDLTAAWEDALAVDAEGADPGWIHSDLAPGNLLLRGGKLAAVIDFSGVGMGDPACDLYLAWNLFTGDARRHLREALGVEEEEWVRGRGWALSIALLQLPYYRKTNIPLAESSRYTIRAVLGEGCHGGRRPLAC